MIRHDFSFPPKSASSSVNKNLGAYQHSVHSGYRGNNGAASGNGGGGGGYHNQNHLALPTHHQAFPHHLQNQRSSDNCNVHYNHQACGDSTSASGGVGLCKSASTSLLSSHQQQTNNNNNSYFNNNNNNDNGKGQSSCASCNSCETNHVAHENKTQGSKVNAFPSRFSNAAGNETNHLRPSASSGSIMQGPMDPTTPKDSDCSFSKLTKS